MIRGVIFDLGGTLATPHPPLSDEDLDRRNAVALLAWLQRRSGHVDDGFVDTLVAARQAGYARRLVGTREVTAAEVLYPVLQSYQLPAGATFAQEAEEAFFEPELASMRALPEANALLEWVRERGLHAALASNASSHYFVTECCRRLGFARWLDPIVSSAELGWTKPSPPIFEAILARWSLPPGVVVMVGDTPSADIAGAAHLGMRSILLTGGASGSAAAGPRPEAIASDLAAVREILARWVTARQ